MTSAARLAANGAAADYEKQIPIDASRRPCSRPSPAVEGLANWWTTGVEGSAVEGGELQFRFNGPESCDIHVVAVVRPRSVRWRVRACPFLPDWVGTRPTFTITPTASGCELHFRHHGLNAELECFDQCREGWDDYLPSFTSYVESGRGRPFIPS